MKIKIADIYIDNVLNEGRGAIREKDVESLMDSISADGLIQPVVVAESPGAEHGLPYELVAGYRRTSAHKFLGLDEINAEVKPPMDEGEKRKINLKENIERKDLNVLQEAYALKYFKDRGFTANECAKYLGTSYGRVQPRYMILTFPVDTHELFLPDVGGFSLQNARDLNTIMLEQGETAFYEAVRQIKMAKGVDIKKSVSINKNRVSQHGKIIRTKTEILLMINHVLAANLEGPISLTLAWAIGEVSTSDLFDEYEAHAYDIGEEFKRPEERSVI